MLNGLLVLLGLLDVVRLWLCLGQDAQRVGIHSEASDPEPGSCCHVGRVVLEDGGAVTVALHHLGDHVVLLGLHGDALAALLRGVELAGQLLLDVDVAGDDVGEIFQDQGIIHLGGRGR